MVPDGPCRSAPAVRKRFAYTAAVNRGRSGSAFWGAVLVLLGIVFLLANTGVLNNVNWDYVWPVLLIAVGVWLILARIGPGGTNASLDSAEPREGLQKARLEVAVGAGQVDVRSAQLGDELYRLHLDHAGQSPQIKFDRSTGTVSVSQRFDWFIGARRLHLDAQINDALSLDLSCATGAIRGTFDLASITLTSFDCQTGASRIDLSLGAPKGVVPLRIQGGGLTVDVVRPAGAAMKVNASGGAVQLRADGSRQDGVGSRAWSSSGAEAAADRYELSISGGAVTVNVSGR